MLASSHILVKYRRNLRNRIKRHWILYLLLIVPLTWVIVFHYIPMYGVIMAFQNFSIKKGYFGSQWVGTKHFERFITSPNFTMLLKNTLAISLYSMVANFCCQVVFALMLNEVTAKRYRKTVQMFSYLPYFISVVTVVDVAIKLMQIFDYFASEEGTFVQFNGLEGYYWEYAKEGELNAKGEQAKFRTFTTEEMVAKYGEDQANWMNSTKVAFGWGWPAYMTPEYKNTVAQPVTEYTSFSQKFTNEYLEKVYEGQLVNDKVFPSTFIFSEEALYDIALWQTDIDNYVNQSEAEFVMGQRNINDDAQWQAYIDHLNGLGLADWLVLVQKEWDAAQK